MEKNEALQAFYSLPQEAQQQVLDFIAFLQTRKKVRSPGKKIIREQITSEPFVGIWKDRENMTNSSEWVRKTRTTEWGALNEP
ncbi:MAG: hypothetical protein OHK0052_16490 [Anaerolineales bacterium]